MANEKPLVEVMAIAFHNEVSNLRGGGGDVVEWEHLPRKYQDETLAAMTKVARMLKYFESNGMIIVRSKKPRHLSADPPTDEADRITAALDPMTTQSEAGIVPEVGGDLCDICGQLAVVRESACRTRCRSCGAIDGGCG